MDSDNAGKDDAGSWFYLLTKHSSGNAGLAVKLTAMMRFVDPLKTKRINKVWTSDKLEVCSLHLGLPQDSCREKQGRLQNWQET